MPVISVYCALCGRPMAINSWAKVPAFGPKTFGIIQRGLGRGKGFKTVGHIHITDAPEVFELIKDRMFGVLSYWFERGFVTKSDVERAFGFLKELAKKSLSVSLFDAIDFQRKKVMQTSQNFWDVISYGKH